MSEELRTEELLTNEGHTETMADYEDHFDDANPWNRVLEYMEKKTILPVKIEGIVNGGAIAMGNGSQSRGDWGVAIGNGAKALAAGARALGANSNASGVNAAAIGWDSEASGASSIAVGETVKSTGTNSVAIGTGAKAANENAIALGAGSETAAAVATPSATINGTAHNFAGVNPASTVSVGKAGSERTITNVAAGRISAASTDAITAASSMR